LPVPRTSSMSTKPSNSFRQFKVSIPTNLATDSEGIWPTLPIERGHLF
jgi:hypothetical protein